MKIFKGLACLIAFTAMITVTESVYSWECASDCVCGTFCGTSHYAAKACEDAQDNVNCYDSGDYTDANTELADCNATCADIDGLSNFAGTTAAEMASQCPGSDCTIDSNSFDRECAIEKLLGTTCGGSGTGTGTGTGTGSGPGSYAVYENEPECTGTCDPDGGMVEELVSRFEAATSTIDCSVYGFDHPSLAQGLIDADARGVTVRVVTDDDNFDAASKYNQTVLDMQAGGVEVEPVNASGIMHTKYCIMDSTDVFSGTANFTTTGFPLNHNFFLYIDGSPDTVTAFECNFDESWGHCDNNECGPSNRTTNCNNNNIDIGGKTVEICFSPQGDCITRLRGTGTHTTGKLGTCANPDSGHECGANDVCTDYVYNGTSGAEDRHACDTCDDTGSLPAGLSSSDNLALSVFFFTDACTMKALQESAPAVANKSNLKCLWDALGAKNAYSMDEKFCDNGFDCYIEDWAGKNHSKVGVFGDALFIGSMNWSNNGNANNDEQTVIIHDSTLAGEVYADITEDIGRISSACSQASSEVCDDGSDNDYNGAKDYCDSQCGCTNPAADCLSCNDAPEPGTSEDGCAGSTVDCNVTPTDPVCTSPGCVGSSGEGCGQGGETTSSITFSEEQRYNCLYLLNDGTDAQLDAINGVGATGVTNIKNARPLSTLAAFDAISGMAADEIQSCKDDAVTILGSNAYTTDCPLDPIEPSGSSCETVCIDTSDGSCYCTSSDSTDMCYDANCDASMAALDCVDNGDGTYKCTSTGGVDTGLLRNAAITTHKKHGVVRTNTKWYAFDEDGLSYEQHWCESPHPYDNDCGYSVSGCANDAMYYCGVYRSNATKVAVWFSGFDIEYAYDKIRLKDSNGTQLGKCSDESTCIQDSDCGGPPASCTPIYYTGPSTADTYSYGWSRFVPGTSLNLYLDTDDTVTDWGFSVSAIAVATPSTGSDPDPSEGGGGGDVGTSCTTDADCTSPLTCQKVKGKYSCQP